MTLEYTIKKPEDNPGEVNIKEKYTIPVIPGKEVIILDQYEKPYDLSKKTIILGFHADEKTEKNTGKK